MHTPRSLIISEAAGGYYWYRGIRENLALVFANLTENITITLNFNIDGLPCFKSSKTTFWPILSTIQGIIN